MFKSSLGSSLGLMQFFCLLGAGALHLCGIDLTWCWILAPIWLLLGVAITFWLIVGLVYRAFA